MNYEREQEIFNYFSSCVTAEDGKKMKRKNEKEKEKMQVGLEERNRQTQITAKSHFAIKSR